tara:strand:- start:242 stop:541 length:300 start_codon:yes stop_codon:yes gene_type:complete
MSNTMKINSINSRENTEKAWDEDARLYGDISPEWDIAIGNGKRNGRKWRKKRGLLFTVIAGSEHTIYNEKYDVGLLNARHTSEPIWDQSTLIPYHVGMD